MGLICASMATPLHADDAYGTVINLAGRQRMLTQKMSKEILLAAYSEEYKDNFANAAKTADLFENTLQGLWHGNADLGLPGTTSRRIVRQLGKIESLWTPFKDAMTSMTSTHATNQEQLDIIISTNPSLLAQMNKAVKLYEKEANDGSETTKGSLAITINLAGKQRMLTQKMSKEYLLIALGHDVETQQLYLLETYELFDRTLKGLRFGDEVLELNASLNNEAVSKQLETVATLWSQFKPLMAAAAADGQSAISPENIATVAKQNLPLLKEMNKAVGLYELISQD